MITTIIVSVLSFILYQLYIKLDCSKTLGPSTPSCNLLSPHLLSVEDLVTYRPGILLGSSSSMLELTDESPERMDPGHIISIDVRQGMPIVRNVTMIGTPDGEDWAFHPHGIMYSRDTERLYTVNHSGASRGGSRISVFHVIEREIENGEVSGDGSAPIELEWITDVGKGYFPNLTPNSVVEASPDEIYVTQWMIFPVPLGGKHYPASITERFYNAANYANALFSFPKLTSVHHCRFDISSSSSSQCRTVARDFLLANGITITHDRSEIMVVDVLQKEMRVFQRDAETGDLEEMPARRLALPHAVDNVHLDGSTGELWMGSIPLIYQQLKPEEPQTGTFLVGYPKREGGGDDGGGGEGLFAEVYEWADEVIHDGKKLSQMSACAKLEDERSGMRWNVCGGPRGKGILVCDV